MFAKPGFEPGRDSCLPLNNSESGSSRVSANTGRKRIPDPSARDNRKDDVGTSQLSGSPTLNTPSQTSEGIPTSSSAFVEGTAPHPVVSFCPLGDRKQGSPHFLKVENDVAVTFLQTVSDSLCLDSKATVGKGISMRVSRPRKIFYKTEPNWGDVVNLSRWLLQNIPVRGKSEVIDAINQSQDHLWHIRTA